MFARHRSRNLELEADDVAQPIEERHFVQWWARRIPGDDCGASGGTGDALRNVVDHVALPEAERAQRRDPVTRRFGERGCHADREARRDSASGLADVLLRDVEQTGVGVDEHHRAHVPDSGTQRDAQGRAVADEVARRLSRLRPDQADHLLGKRSQHRACVQPPESRLHGCYPETAIAAAIAAARAGSRTTRRNGS